MHHLDEFCSRIRQVIDVIHTMTHFSKWVTKLILQDIVFLKLTYPYLLYCSNLSSPLISPNLSQRLLTFLLHKGYLKAPKESQDLEKKILLLGDKIRWMNTLTMLQMLTNQHLMKIMVLFDIFKLISFWYLNQKKLLYNVISNSYL